MAKGQFQRDSVITDLRNSVIEVFFTKVGGADRIMKCTLRPEMLPSRYINEDINEEKKFHAENPDVIRCWSVDDQGWRSFKIDNVTYLQDVTANYV